MKLFFFLTICPEKLTCYGRAFACVSQCGCRKVNDESSDAQRWLETQRGQQCIASGIKMTGNVNVHAGLARYMVAFGQTESSVFLAPSWLVCKIELHVHVERCRFSRQPVAVGLGGVAFTFPLDKKEEKKRGEAAYFVAKMLWGEL